MHILQITIIIAGQTHLKHYHYTAIQYKQLINIYIFYVIYIT